MIDVTESRAPEIRHGDSSYTPVARTWRIGYRWFGITYTAPHRIEATDGDRTEWVRIRDPVGTVKLVGAIIMVLGFVRRRKD